MGWVGFLNGWVGLLSGVGGVGGIVECWLVGC